VAVSEQDIIQRLRAGQLAPEQADKFLEDERLEERAGTLSPEAGPTRAEPIDTPGQALRAGVESGVSNINAQNKNFKAAIATIRGNNEDAENFLREGDRFEDESAIPLAGMESFGEFLDEPTIGGFFNQVAAATGQFVPSLAASFAEAAVVGGIVAGGTILTGGTATPGLILGAGALQAAGRQGLKQIPKTLAARKPDTLKENAEELLNKAYKNALADKKGRDLPFPELLTDKDSLAALDDIYAQLRSQKLGSRFTKGALAGAYNQEQRMGTGISFSDYADEGMRSPEDAIAALGQGQVFGAIGLGAEAATAGVLLKKLKKGGKLKVSTRMDDAFTPEIRPTSTFFGDMLETMTVTSVSEGIAEGLQEELSVQQKLDIDQDYTQANAKVDRLNALFAGFFGGVGVGGALGGGTGAMNKLRELTNMGKAEEAGLKMFKQRYNESEMGRVMAERATALESQFDFVANTSSNKDSAFIDIDSKSAADLNKLQKILPDAFSVATARGAFFTTDATKAQEFQNLVTLYPFNTELQDAYLAERGLGYSRTRKTGDDMVVGILDTKSNELVHYQGTSSTFENDFEKAKAKMQEILGNADPKRYKIISQTLAEHRAYRLEGLEVKGTTPFKSVKEAFQITDDNSEMGTDGDDSGQAEASTLDMSVTQQARAIEKGQVTQAQSRAFDSYIQDTYKLPITYKDLVFFVNMVSSATKGAQSTKQITSVLKKAAPAVKTRLSKIYSAVVGAEKASGVRNQNDRNYLKTVKESPANELGLLLQELSELGSGIEQDDSITSPMRRMDEEGVDVRNIPGVGVTEILNKTNVVVDQQDSSFTKEPLGPNNPTVAKRFGSGTVENPFVDSATKKAFRISKDDPKANGNAVNGAKSYVHPTLQQEYEQQKPYISKKLLEQFITRSKEESNRTEGVGYIRIVNRSDIPGIRTASKKGEVFQSPILSLPDAKDFKGKKLNREYQKQLKNYKDRGFVLVRMQPEEKQFLQAAGRNPSEVRNVKEDLRTRIAQAKERTQGGNYKDPIYFKVKDLDAGLSEATPAGKIDIAVLLEGITTITKITRRRDSGELTTQYSQRVAALLDGITLLEQQGFVLEYYPDTIKGETGPVNITSQVQRRPKPSERKDPKIGPRAPTISINALLDDLLTSRAGAQVLKVILSKDEKQLQAQLKELEKKFALTDLSKNMFTEQSFTELSTPFLEFPSLKSKKPGEEGALETLQRKELIAPFVQNLEENTIEELTLDQLQELKEKIENVSSMTWSGAFEGEPPVNQKGYRTFPKRPDPLEQEAQELEKQLSIQDRIYAGFLAPISSVIAAIEAQDKRNSPGTFVKDDKASFPRDVNENTGKTTYQERKMERFVDVGGSINREVPIGTYIADIQAIEIERQTDFLEDSGLFQTDDLALGNPVDTSAVKMDLQDAALFESYQDQQGKAFRGRNQYYDMSRGTVDKTKLRQKISTQTSQFEQQQAFKYPPQFSTKTSKYVLAIEGPLQQFKENKEATSKPGFQDNRKFKGANTVFLLKDVLAQRAAATTGNKTTQTQSKRASLPFRQQIIKGLTTSARNLGLETNLKVISAEAELNDSQLSAAIQGKLDMKHFESKRKKLLNNDNALAMTLQYRDFDVILMKTNKNVSEGAYYAAYLKELGNSLTFQELEKSLKVPAVRKKLLEAYEKIRKGKNAPATYTNNETGFNNFVADQYSLAIRDKLGLNVDGTTYRDMNAPAQNWFKRLANSQKKLYGALSKPQRQRLDLNETFDEYSRDLQDKIRNPENQQVPYEVKAKIETQLESILGPQTYTDKQLRKVLEQANKLLTTKNMPKWLRAILLTTDTRLRQFGTPGEAIADFFNLDPRSVGASGRAGIFTLKTRRANAMLNDVAKILGVEDGWFYSTFNEEQKAAINLAANDEIAMEDLNNPQAAELRRYLETLYEDLGLKNLDVDFRKNFFPRVIAIAEIATDENKQTTLFNLLKEYNPKAKDATLRKVITDLVSKNNGDIEFTAKEEIDVGVLYARKQYFEAIPNQRLIDTQLAEAPEVALKKYLDKVALRYEFDKSGGTVELERLLSKLSEAQRQEAEDMINSMFGKIKPIQNGLLRTANNFGLTLNVITLLGLTVIASLQDTAGPILRARGTAKISDVTNVIKDMIKDPQEAADLAREVGVIGVDAMSSFFVLAGEQDFMGQSAKDITDTWFRVTGLEAYTRFTRVFATGMGTRFLQDHARKAQNGNVQSQTYLKELNITADEVLAWEKGKTDKATREKVNEALAQFVDESIVRPNPAQRPAYANDPRYALIWQLKSFFYAYGKTIVFPALKESHKGFVNQGAGAGAMPILMMAGMLLPITMLGLEIREMFKAFLAWVLPGISPNDPGVNYFKSDDMSTGQYMTEIIDRSGMLGPASLALPVFLESHRYGNPFWIPPLGPTAERVYDGVTLDWRPSDFLPVYSQLDTRNLGR